jgi:hypothetical protein
MRPATTYISSLILPLLMLQQGCATLPSEELLPEWSLPRNRDSRTVTCTIPATFHLIRTP